MKKILKNLTVMFTLFLTGAGGVYAGTQLATKPETTSTPALVDRVSTGSSVTGLEDVIANIKDAVVEIETETQVTNYRRQAYVQSGAGSGVIVNAEGYIITNYHVIDGADKIIVRTTDGKEYEAEVVKSDEKKDLALLKISGDKFTFARLGDSDKLVLGETAIAIGNPLGSLGGTVTEGIVSALNREINLSGVAMNLIQTSAAINSGNSGGGLFDRNGALIGIVVAKSSGVSIEGLGFAIPVNEVISFIGTGTTITNQL